MCVEGKKSRNIVISIMSCTRVLWGFIDFLMIRNWLTELWSLASPKSAGWAGGLEIRES